MTSLKVDLLGGKTTVPSREWPIAGVLMLERKHPGDHAAAGWYDSIRGDCLAAERVG